MAELAAFGVAADLPPGWDGEVYSPDGAEIAAAGTSGRAVLHAATFPLPPGRGDFGSGAVETMRPGDVYVILFEYGRESAGRPLFSATGIPALEVADFSDRTMPRRLPGLVGAQRFFTAEGRAFCLHAIIAARELEPDLVAIANAILASVRID